MTIRKLSIILMLFLVSLAGNGQKKDSLEIIYKKVEVIESEKQLAQKEYEIYKKGLEVDYKNAKSEVNNKLEIIAWLIGVLGIGGLIAILVFIVKYANKAAAIQIEKKLTRIFLDEKGKLIQLIKSQNEENQLKEDKIILVLSNKESDDEFIKRFFKEMGFKKCAFEKIMDYQKVMKEYDLIFFNNEDSILSQEVMKQYIDNAKDETMFFHFGSVRFSDMEAKNNKVIFANLRTQVYGNLINALRFHKFIQRS